MVARTASTYYHPVNVAGCIRAIKATSERAGSVGNTTIVVSFLGSHISVNASGPAPTVPNDTLYAFGSALGTLQCSSTT